MTKYKLKDDVIILSKKTPIDILWKFAKKEINKIKTHFTKEEINKLDFNTLCGDCTDKCIYGQMTGNCNTPRAVEFIKNLDVVIKGSNDDIKPGENFDENQRDLLFLSPLEEYIYNRGYTVREIDKRINKVKKQFK